MNSSVLIIDDDSDALLSLSRALKTKLPQTKIVAASNPDKAISMQSEFKPLAVVLDLCLVEAEGVKSGLGLLKQLLRLDPTTRVIILTGHSDNKNGIECLQQGAASFVAKPADIGHLAALIQDAIKQCLLKREYQNSTHSLTENILSNLIGKSLIMQNLKEQIKFAASNQQAILLTGETGTGKGLCAQLIHKLSNQSHFPFIRYQPNFTAPEMVSSDLFGHLKGAYTGADKDRKGLLAEVEGGTLFLDEIDELPIQTQVGLLGVLQDKSYRPLGSNQEISANFRLISACNKSINKSLESGNLRLDFFHRIAHIEVKIPPLRERVEDIEELANFFLKQQNLNEQLPVISIADDVLNYLKHYDWPGNIREFQATIESAAFHAHYRGQTEIELVDLPTHSKDLPREGNKSLSDQVNNFKRRIVTETLAKCNNNQMHAAHALEIDRSTVRRILGV